MEFREHVSLAPYTTFGIGGPARWFAEAGSEEELREGIGFARERGLALFVLGGGSNVLVADGGWDGLVLHVISRGMTQNGGVEGKQVLSVAAGENWDTLVQYAVEQGLGGMECLAGIPGTVGGTPIQNVGAYGQEVSSTIEKVRVLDTISGESREFSKAECGFAYRTSVFNTVERGRYLVSRVDFALRESAQPLLAYADLQRWFAGKRPGLVETAEAVRHIRAGKGMVIVPGEADSRGAGSFFKNPVVRAEKLEEVAAAVGLEVADVPHYASAEGWVKLPAAWLLERAGFTRGYRRGRAGLSTRHTLALTNRGGATAAEVLALRDEILAGVEGRFGIRLEIEPVMVGSSQVRTVA